MALKAFVSLFKKRQLLPALRLNALYKPFYELCFLAAAKQSGVLDALSASPKTFDALAEHYCHDDKSREALAAWLRLGVRLGALRLAGGAYRLRGLARRLALPENDAALALAQEVVTLHHKLILETPTKLRSRELWELADQDGELTARSSLALEAFQVAAIEAALPRSGATQLLEIGCGSGHYIRHAARLNPSLQALGLELQPDVAAIAQRHVREWGLSARVTIDVGDIRLKTPDRRFDVVTLYNNIYYFPFEDRVPLLAHVRRFVKDGGFLLLTTCCQGGNVSIEVLNLWGAATRGGGRLPTVAEMSAQLAEAGFGKVEATSLIPGDRFFAFRARPA